MLPLLFVRVLVDDAVIYPEPLLSWLLLVIVLFNVTLPDVPPPLSPVPATTAVISPCGTPDIALSTYVLLAASVPDDTVSTP